MKIAIMQPYIFPYIGYFQLINLVDKFIMYDDVNYINKGWINRNNIKVNGQKYMFTIPLVSSSQNKLICNIDINSGTNWKNKFVKTIAMGYRKAPYFNQFFEYLETSLNEGIDNLAGYNYYQLKRISQYLDIKTEIVESSSKYKNSILKGQERIVDICKQENASHYINPIGGLELYKKQKFEDYKINLKFIKPISFEYKQIGPEFIPWLSIIDLIMHNSKDEIKIMLCNNFELV